MLLVSKILNQVINFFIQSFLFYRKLNNLLRETWQDSEQQKQCHIERQKTNQPPFWKIMIMSGDSMIDFLIGWVLKPTLISVGLFFFFKMVEWRSCLCEKKEEKFHTDVCNIYTHIYVLYQLYQHRKIRLIICIFKLSKFQVIFSFQKKNCKKLITCLTDHDKVQSGMMAEFVNVSGREFFNICYVPPRMNAKEILQFISQNIIYLL